MSARFNLPDINFLEVDSQRVTDEIIAEYERITDRALAPSDPVRLFLLSLAAIIIKQRNAFDLGAKQNLLSYASGERLDHLGAFVNTTRIEATGAQTTLKFTLNQAQDGVYTIPKGTRVTNGVFTFATDSIYEIMPPETTAEISATALELGEIGNNIPVGKINQLVDPLPSITKVENITATSGAGDREDDERYAMRIKLAPASFSVAGPAKAYEYHTLSYSTAIIDAKIYGLEDHPGNVYIHPLLTNGELPQTEFLEALTAYLNADTIRPLTDKLMVSAPTAVNYQITATWYLSKDDINRINQVKEQVTKAVEDYRLWQQSKIGADINPDVLIEYVRKAGAKRIVITEPEYKVVQQSEVAQCLASAVNLTYGGIEDQ
ncbi:baseplate assembly protein [Anaerobiospirillum thomasii]|uniref:Uncharacterized homolog of phage Mu protein gp47 n=1 Tax=Anaerobiospirillum thomasii TaxID=179995 RepID=A0A2X0VQU1_9GAMM|nr:baseplate J/gp47 family protein [Anaerobiospirillum thomasii]SPT70120.1 Uncharacterized homolog of phage Mu protein gp47 [Anaerobiospirillum thomasii]